MSKSLGNFYTVTELLSEFPGEALRLALLKTHYRQPLDFTKDGVREAKRELDGFYGALRRASDVEPVEPQYPMVDFEAFRDALYDDLNTPLALSHLYGRVRQLNLSLREDSAGNIIARSKNKWLLIEMGKWLGLLRHDPEEWLKGDIDIEASTAELKITGYPANVSVEIGASTKLEASLEVKNKAIDEQIEKRNQAREKKDYAEADRIRDQLKDQGVILEDRPDGSTDWRRGS